jgi:hypothetical protein
MKRRKRKQSRPDADPNVAAYEVVARLTKPSAPPKKKPAKRKARINGIG